MKKLALFGLLIFLVFVSSAHAQLISNVCGIQTGVANTVEGTNTHVKMDYHFSCSADMYEGQLTRMVLRMPYSNIENLEASDSYGSMEVLEGPSYYSVSTEDDESVLGVMFRSGLLITDETNTYDLAIEFDSNSLIDKSEEDIYTIKPAGLAANPKLTIISPTGITESTTVVGNYDYRLEFEDTVSVDSVSPNACTLSSGVVSCENMAGTVFDDIVVKWTATSGGWGGGIGDWLGQYTGDILPGLTDIFGGIWDSISGAIE